MSEEEFEKELKINDENWSKEIDRLREIDQNEIVKLRSIIKEVRDTIEDYIDNYNSFGDYEIHWECKSKLLEILDKENSNE